MLIPFSSTVAAALHGARTPAMTLIWSLVVIEWESCSISILEDGIKKCLWTDLFMLLWACSEYQDDHQKCAALRIMMQYRI